jgi:hypothetical protein
MTSTEFLPNTTWKIHYSIGRKRNVLESDKENSSNLEILATNLPKAKFRSGNADGAISISLKEFYNS